MLGSLVGVFLSWVAEFQDYVGHRWVDEPLWKPCGRISVVGHRISVLCGPPMG